MTAWRVGLAIKPEAKFGVEDTSEQWHYIGIGMDFNFTENNQWKFQNGLGSKVPELEYEGRFSGTWGGNLYLDYNNFYWLQFGLEEYSFVTDNYQTEDAPSGRNIGIHIFSTSNKKALKSFSLRILKLDREVGGYDDTTKLDEEIILLGCTMNKVSPAYEGGSTSAIKVGIGGSFVDTQLTAKTVDDTVTTDVLESRNNVRAINWGCLQVMDKDGSAWEKIANNEKTGFTFSRTISTVPDCGARIDTAYYESAIQPIGITALVYSRNPNQWQTRMHTGGARNDLTTSGATSKPRNKGLEAIPNIRIASGTPNPYNRTPDYLCYAEFEDVVVDSWGNSYNSGSEITESPTLKARTGRIIFRTPDVLTQIDSNANDAVKVTYDFDNGTVQDLISYYPKGYEITLLDYKGVKAGSTFAGWDVYDATRQPGEKVKLTADTVITAQWQENAQTTH